MFLSHFFKIVLFVILVGLGTVINVFYFRELRKNDENLKGLAKLKHYFKFDTYK